MASITLDTVRKQFGDVVAVEDVDLEIEDGEFISIVGPSGCGKTTTLRLIAGLEQLTSGRIFFGDTDVSNTPAKKRGIGMVFQNLALYPHMSVRENMEFGLSVADVPQEEQDERIVKIAEMLDIAELLDREPSELSGGQQQRVAIGRTMVLEPNVFLLDEPLASLDAKLRVEIREELQELQKEIGVTTIYVTHDQEQAMTMSDRVIVINDGKVQQFATPEEIYNEPANRFVSHFIGTPSMNFVDAQLSASSNSLTADFGSVHIDLERPADSSPELLDSDATLGIRPEHLDLSTTVDPTGSNTVSAQVRIVEHTGANKIVHLSIDGRDFTALVPESTNVQNGDEATVRFPPENVYMYDSESGDRLYYRSSIDSKHVQQEIENKS
ncbi:ABC transporter [Natrialba chahannaoensis JCM 10990]|uniref:ABC-type D-xylose/L-arabinose transporter n=1 Tax=Natrialba chahannaoensis JCM 10990 TaxID=1227492 RepID=M0B2I2_9EURY|nr:ABC transporter ATP-binding protein [Natrialba chahannaoensis]ELZ04767.1 ABC transporter [Natrialba chahannaoensis JCM 10990]